MSQDYRDDWGWDTRDMGIGRQERRPPMGTGSSQSSQPRRGITMGHIEDQLEPDKNGIYNLECVGCGAMITAKDKKMMFALRMMHQCDFSAVILDLKARIENLEEIVLPEEKV